MPAGDTLTPNVDRDVKTSSPTPTNIRPASDQQAEPPWDEIKVSVDVLNPALATVDER